MNGKGHIVTGTTVLADAVLAGALSQAGRAPAFLQEAGRKAIAALCPLEGGVTPVRVALTAGCALAYYIGVLLPDIDLQGSTISKLLHVHLPLRHRGATHSLWAACGAGALYLALKAPYGVLALWLMAGMLVHDLIDSLSQAGWVPFYPLGRWRLYKDTVMTRARRHKGWYSSSAPGSEEAMCGFLIVLSAVLGAFLAYLAWWPS